MERKEISGQLIPVFAEKRFGMELHAAKRPSLVLNGHDHPIGSPSQGKQGG